MLGFLILLMTLAGGFCAGYATRDVISRRRRTEYLKYKPYTAPSEAPSRSTSPSTVVLRTGACTFRARCFSANQ